MPTIPNSRETRTEPLARRAHPHLSVRAELGRGDRGGEAHDSFQRRRSKDSLARLQSQQAVQTGGGGGATW